jgi:hypothetical protein
MSSTQPTLRDDPDLTQPLSQATLLEAERVIQGRVKENAQLREEKAQDEINAEPFIIEKEAAEKPVDAAIAGQDTVEKNAGNSADTAVGNETTAPNEDTAAENESAMNRASVHAVWSTLVRFQSTSEEHPILHALLKTITDPSAINFKDETECFAALISLQEFDDEFRKTENLNNLRLYNDINDQLAIIRPLFALWLSPKINLPPPRVRIPDPAADELRDNYSTLYEKVVKKKSSHFSHLDFSDSRRGSVKFITSLYCY